MHFVNLNKTDSSDVWYLKTFFLFSKHSVENPGVISNTTASSFMLSKALSKPVFLCSVNQCKNISDSNRATVALCVLWHTNLLDTVTHIKRQETRNL